MKESGYDQAVLFDRSATLTSPSFPEVEIPLAPIFEPISGYSQSSREDLGERRSASAGYRRGRPRGGRTP